MKRYVTRRQTLATVGAGTALLAGCLGDSDDTDDENGDDTDDDDGTGNGEPIEGGTLHVTQALERAEEFDPIISNGAYSNQVWEHIYDRLYEWDDGLGLEPKVAVDEPEIERDDTRFLIEINDGIEFHNGDELTASDVVHSFLAPVEEQTDVMPHYQMIEDAEVIDEYQLQVDLEYPSGYFSTDSIGVAIVPEEVRTADRDEFLENPVGSGPFKWHDFEYNEYVEIERNDDYWDDPLPNLEMVRYEAVQDDTTRVSNIRAGDTDIIMAPSDANWEVLEGEDDVQLHSTSSYGFHFVGFHCIDGAVTSDVDVRRGVAHAFSVPGWVQDELPNIGEVYTDIFGDAINEEWDFPADRWADMYPEYDPDLAQELLDENAPDDWEPTIISTPDVRGDLAEEIALRLDELGYNAEYQPLDLLPLVERINEGDPDAYDIWLFGYAGGPDPDEYVFNLLHESLQHESISTFYDGSDDFHDKIMDARQSVDQDERYDLYVDIMDEVLENVPLLPAFDTLHAAASMNHVRDFNLSPNVYINPRLSSPYGNIWLDE